MRYGDSSEHGAEPPAHRKVPDQRRTGVAGDILVYPARIAFATGDRATTLTTKNVTHQFFPAAQAEMAVRGVDDGKPHTEATPGRVRLNGARLRSRLDHDLTLGPPR